MIAHRSVLAGCAVALLAAGSVGAAQLWGAYDGQVGLLQDVAHRHMHRNAHELLGERIRHEGRHEIEKIKGRSVVAEVRHGKVEKMDAEDLPMKRVKEHRKMAGVEGAFLRVALSPIQLAQYDPTYYGYCFDDGVGYNCYWYPAEDVNYQDYTWEPYDPTY